MNAQQPSIFIEEITPREAGKLLEANINNRHLRREYVAVIARDMKEGRWQFNGDAIRIAQDGTLLDGQHRLHGCALSGVTLKTLVVRGLPNETMRTVDTGTKRTAGDSMHLTGVADATFMAAVIRAMATYAVSSTTLSASEVAFLYEKFSTQIRAGRRYSIAGLTSLRCPLSALHTINIILGKQALSEKFVKTVESGVPSVELGGADPAFQFQQRYTRESNSNNRMSRTNVFRALAYSWNLFEEQRKIKKLQMPPSHVLINGWDSQSFGLDVARVQLTDAMLGLKKVVAIKTAKPSAQMALLLVA